MCSGLQILARECLGSGDDPADVESIVIGFGFRVNTTTSGGAGMVYLDDIKVYPCRPVGLATDLSDDCLVDLTDLAIFMDSWLSKL